MVPAKCFTSVDPPRQLQEVSTIISPTLQRRKQNLGEGKSFIHGHTAREVVGGIQAGPVGLLSHLPRDPAATLQVGDTGESLKLSNTPKLGLRSS